MSNNDLIQQALLKYPGNAFLYYGGVSREGYSAISSALEKRTDKKEKVCLILVTYGGDPDAAYRIARALKHHYEEVEILIPDLCKSAGTLICIGANRLIFGDRGELGPLDIQISKPDELFESMSGLDLIQALAALQNQILSSFRLYLVDIRSGSRLRTKLAAELATKLAEGFISPIAAKIDPVTLGEHQRAMQIAYDYGLRLSKMTDSLKPHALERLVSDYSSHGFVIDRKEAASIFNQIAKPDETTDLLYSWARGIVETCPMEDSPIVIDLEEGILEKKQTDETDKSDKETEPFSTKESDSEFDVDNPAIGEGNEDKPNAARSGRSRSKSPSSNKNQAEQDA